ncbi:MAG: Na+/H+ antiporter NhaA [Candidatus Hydrogenedentes bacterium]|nr:Na+/H+ antiporter NhaA [Candidatus Hydrogenedentota bacterium]
MPRPVESLVSDELPELEESSPLLDFLTQDAVAALLLLVSALAALVLANSGAREWYVSIWSLELGGSFGTFHLEQSLRHWINDGLMAVFFFMVGLEIKRELLVGELGTFRKALLPAVAAIGGMLVPAAIYATINWGSPTIRGWGIPMATDIAFASGCLGLLHNRAPRVLTVFLVALAIVDDLGSVAVIALFYTERIAGWPLAVGGLLLAVSFLLNCLRVRRTLPYVVIGVVVWFEFLQSGVHATVAGVLLAFTIPADARYETPLFWGRMTTLLKRFRDAEDYVNPRMVNSRQQSLVRSILGECHHVEAPLQRIEYALHPVCVILILPLFAFCNSGVIIDFTKLGDLLFQRVTVGVFLGLLAGKQVGILLASWITVRFGWTDLPKGVRWRQMYGLSWLGAIGFTMALFIDELAFGHGLGDAAMTAHLNEAKIGIFLASLVGGVVGYLLLRTAGSKSSVGRKRRVPRQKES